MFKRKKNKKIRHFIRNLTNWNKLKIVKKFFANFFCHSSHFFKCILIVISGIRRFEPDPTFLVIVSSSFFPISGIDAISENLGNTGCKSSHCRGSQRIAQCTTLGDMAGWHHTAVARNLKEFRVKEKLNSCGRGSPCQISWWPMSWLSTWQLVAKSPSRHQALLALACCSWTSKR